MPFEVFCLRQAVRLWLRAPLVACVALLSLTLGIGAGTAILGVIDALHLRLLPVAHASTLVRLCARTAAGEVADSVYSVELWEAFRRHQPLFSGVAAATPSGRLRLVRGGEAVFVQTSYVSGDFFRLLGVPMARGRHLDPRDADTAAVPVAVIDHALWQERFGGVVDAIGSTVTVGDRLVQIVGVTAPEFFGVEVGKRVGLYLPLSALAATSGWREASGSHSAVRVFCSLRKGQQPADAANAVRAWQPVLRSVASSVGGGLEEELGEPLDLVSASHGVSPLRRELRLPLVLLLCGSALVLTLACTNLAALMSARFADRSLDLWMRRALGASTGQLVTGLAAETLVLTGAGAVLGVTVALWLTKILVPALVQSSSLTDTPYLAVALDGRLLVLAALLAILTGLATGVPPAMVASRAARGVRAEGAPGSSRTVGGPRRLVLGLVVAQVALSLVVVSTAGVLVRSFLSLTLQPTGLHLDRVLLASLDGPVFDLHPGVTVSRLEELSGRLASVQGVEGVSVSTVTPLEGMIILTRLEVPGYVARENGERVTAVNRVTPSFFDVFGIRLVSGRGFEGRDGSEAAQVAIVNRAFARKYLGAQPAQGRVIKVGGRELQVVGVAADAKYMNLREATTPVVYRPLAQCITADPQPLRIAMRTPTPDRVRPLILHELRQFDGRLNVEFRTLSDEVGSSVRRERLLAWSGVLVAILALGLAALGLYGAFSNLVARRRAEIAVRMALGASPGSVSRLVARAAALVVVAGCVLGVGGIVLSLRFVRAVLFGTEALDPLMIGATVGVIIAVAGLATFVPIRRAALVDPLDTFRRQG